jgi:ribosomal-protein-alanine N-acetyltransferase
VTEAGGGSVTLGDFRHEHVETVLGWASTADDALAWAGVPFLRLGRALLEGWHAEPGVVPCVGHTGGRLCAYGQVCEDRDAGEAEVARVIVAPGLRGHGIGRAFASLLAGEATRRGFGIVVARVRRGDRTGFACYRSAGFTRMSGEEEARMNVDLDHEYVWMRVSRDCY